MSKKQIKLLYVVPYPVLPLVSGGKIRIVQLARSLSNFGVNVTVLAPFKSPEQHLLSKKEPFRIETVKYPFMLPLLFTDRPFPYLYLTSFNPGYGKMFGGSWDDFDVYQFAHASFANLVNNVPNGKPVVYDAHNVDYDYINSECNNELVRNIATKRIFRLEKKLTTDSNHVFACSEKDKDRLVELYGVGPEKISIAPNGISKHDCSNLNSITATQKDIPPQIAGYEKRALYCGSNVNHNRQAVRFILEELAPLLRREWSFVIVGECGKHFKHLNVKNVYFDSDICQFEKYAGMVSAAVNPVTKGSGTSLKVSHYLAHGLPVISTDFGMRGYDSLKPYVTISPLDKFAEALKQEPRYSTEVQKQLELLRWDAIAENMKQRYEALLNNGNARPG